MTITLSTTIEKTTGCHADGTPYVEIHEISTEVDCPAEDGIAYHQALVAVASLLPEERDQVEADLAAVNLDGLDYGQQAAAIAQAIACVLNHNYKR